VGTVLLLKTEESEAGKWAEFDSLGQILRVLEAADLIQEARNEKKFGKLWEHDV